MAETFAMPRLREVILEGMERGLHIGAVAHVRLKGTVVADFAIGAASADTGPVQPLQTDQILLWLSAGKPLTALAIGILADRGKIRFDDPVATIIPEFAENGKESITIRDVLMQAHAYKPPRVDWPRIPREAVIEAICQAEMIPDARPGTYAAYDPQTGWYLLSEIVARAALMPNHRFVREELLLPLGCRNTQIGLEEEAWTELFERDQLAVLHDTTATARESVNLKVYAETDSAQSGDAPDPSEIPHAWAGDDARRAAAHNPGGGACGPARELAAVYQCLLDGGRAPDGRQLLRPETVQEMTSRQRVGLVDHTFRQVVDWGYGFLINSAMYGAVSNPYGYGRHASDATFGHGGMQSSAGFADPEHDIAACLIFNGLPGEAKHIKRANDAITALYEDLGISR